MGHPGDDGRHAAPAQGVTQVWSPSSLQACGFPSVAGSDARVLALGTLPGPESLRQQQYYAQSRNAFWRIMGKLVGAGPELPYTRRLEVLVEHRIALWDVCAAAERKGALDAAIEQRVLPSTSPAHAALSFERKLEQWRVVAEVAARARGAWPANPGAW